MKLRLFTLVLALAAIGQGDFSHLATTDDGDRVFFVTSLRQRGSEQTPRPKVFVLEDGELGLLFEPGPGLFTMPLTPSAIDTSGDGALVAFDVKIPCVGGSSCFLRELSIGFLLDRNSGAQTQPGPHVRISRNGRYILTFSSSGAMGGRSPMITDRATGETTVLDRVSVGDGRISSDGSVLVGSFHGLTHISRSGAVRHMSAPEGSGSVVGRISLSDSGIATYETGPERRSFVVDVATGTSVRLGPENRWSYGATVSNDGAWVLYVSAIGETPQLFFSRRDNSQWRQLTTSGEGVAEAVLSGDGRVAWVSTLEGRLLKIDTASGETTEFLAPPILDPVTSRVVPGSLIHLPGRRLGDKVKIGGREAPVFVSDARDIFAQVPWDLLADEHQPGELWLSVARDDSPLESVTPEYALDFANFFPNAFVPPIHEDWSGFVTPESPARPGELIHIYAVGLGPVDCQLETGVAAPVDKACLPTTAIEWDYWWTATDSMPAEVHFAGLAPGLVGLYQIDARVPWQPPGSRLKLIANRFGFYVVADFIVE